MSTLFQKIPVIRYVLTVNGSQLRLELRTFSFRKTVTKLNLRAANLLPQVEREETDIKCYMSANEQKQTRYFNESTRSRIKPKINLIIVVFDRKMFSQIFCMCDRRGL